MRRERPLSVGLIDLDRFRELNENQGLDTGDRVLEAIAQLVAPPSAATNARRNAARRNSC